MAKREYSGPAIDMTDQYIGERPNNGETVGGTTEDDVFEQSTEWLPAHVDKDDFSEKQKRALRAYLSRTDRETVTMPELAEGNEFSKETARRAVHKAFRDTREFEDLTNSVKLAVLIWACEGLEKTQNELEEQYPVSSRALGEAKRVYPDLIEEKRPITQSQMESAVAEYKKTHSYSHTSSSSNSPGGGGGNETQKTKEEIEYPDDYSETYQWFVETISENPEKKPAEIVEMLPEGKDWSENNYYNIVRDHPGVLKQRINEKGPNDDIRGYLVDKLELDVGSEDANDAGRARSENSSSELAGRVRSIESRLDEIEENVGRGAAAQGDGGSSTDANTLAQLLVNEMSDAEIGAVVRGAIENDD